VAFLLEATEARRQKSSDDDAAAHELAEDLGRLALALEQAAATIEKLRCGFRGYLEIWRNNRERVVGWARPEITGYYHAVEATWQTSVDQLSEDGRHLLERLAFLAPDPVPMFLLDVAVPDAQAEDLHDGLTDLAAVSLTTVDVEGERFSVHRLVQDMTRRSLDATQSRQRITEVLGWVTAAFDGDPSDVRSWARLDPLTPHGLSVTQWADMVGIVEPTARLMSDLGVLLYAKSLHAQAEPLYRRACAIDEASLDRTIHTSRSASITSPHCCKPPTGWRRPNRCCAGHWRSARRASDRIIPLSRPASATSRRCCKPPTGWPRRNR